VCEILDRNWSRVVLTLCREVWIWTVLGVSPELIFVPAVLTWQDQFLSLVDKVLGVVTVLESFGTDDATIVVEQEGVHRERIPIR